MEKRRVIPRRPEKKPTKRTGKNRHRRGLSKTGLAKYLRADCHLYSPLVARPPSPSPSDLSSSKTLRSFGTAKEKRLVEKILEYLKSDSYMYASLIDVGGISAPSPASEPIHQVEKVTVAASRTVMTVEEVIGRQLPPEGSVPEPGVPERRDLGQRETVKRTVYRNCRTSSSAGTDSMHRELRRLVGRER